MEQTRILPFLLAVLLPVGGGIEAAARPSHFDFAPAYPHQVPEFVAALRQPYSPRARMVTVILELDKKGAVKGITAQKRSDSAYAQYAEKWMTSTEFEPATFKGDKTASRMAVILQFQPRAKRPDVYFPVDSSGAIVDADLYFQTLVLNDIHPPQLEEFPPYFCDVDPSDSSIVYRYVLVKVAVDESGAVTGVEEVSSTYPAFSGPIMSAVLWARFAPAVVRGHRVPADCFLLVSFFPQVHYPTQVWRPSDLDTLGLLAKWRVRLLPDTVGLMSKPLPAKLHGDQYTQPGKHVFFRDTVSAVLRVDASGRVYLGRFTMVREELSQAVRQLARRLRFYPAVDYRGRPQRFSGLVSIIFQASSKIRIVHHWLESDGAGTQR